jgi:hypothetical protein
VTSDAQLVALWVPEVRAIVVGMVLRPHTRKTLRCRAVGQCDAIGLINDSARLRQERNHLTIAYGMWLTVIGSADEEQRPGPRARLPSCPRASGIAKALRNAKDRHERSIEGESTVKVADANEDVGEHCERLALLLAD